MNNNTFSWPAFRRVPIIGIIRNLTLEEVKNILPLYFEAGLTTVEITMNTPSAAKIIEYCTKQFANQLNIGAGTVCTLQELKEALAAGSQFIVTPIIDKKVIRECVKNNIPIFPGAYTPTEIHKAWKWGASMVKVFPASTLQPQFIKDVKAPLHQVKLLPTGGITLQNLSEYRKAGADGVGIGGELFDNERIRNQDWPGLKRIFEEFVTEINKP